MRHRLVLTLRQMRLGVLFLWRKRWLPPEATNATKERAAEINRVLEEQRLAAEEFHWVIANERQNPTAVPRIDTTLTPAERVSPSMPSR